MRHTGVWVTIAATLALAACSGGDGDEDATAKGKASTAAPAPVAALVAFSSLTGDAASGKRLFVRCQACHVVEAGVNRVGPSLHGVVGRPAGSIPKVRYSSAMKTSGIVWSEEAIFAYLENPRKSMPGTYMSYAGLRDPQERADVIAYLKTLS